ncbi:transposase [Bradyrhizobium elkanii]|nr:transposase [Bradyrhizobium elkanii]
MIGFAAQRLMELEVEDHTWAAYGEKAPERLAQRNGYRDRSSETRAGTVELRIRKLCEGSYFPSLTPTATITTTDTMRLLAHLHVGGASRWSSPTPTGHQGDRRQGAQRQLAPLSRALHAQCAGP